MGHAAPVQAVTCLGEAAAQMAPADHSAEEDWEVAKFGLNSPQRLSEPAAARTVGKRMAQQWAP